MKNLSLIFAGIFALLAVSCTQEKLDTPPPTSGEVDVTFTTQLARDIATKAYADGSATKNLHYAVYNTGKSSPVHTGVVENFTTTTDVNLKLVSGKTYDFVFWAQDVKNKTYTLKLEDQTLEVKYDENMLSNDETNDAFYAFVPGLEINGAKSEVVSLIRPFAQVNLGTNDLGEIDDNTFKLGKSSMKAKVANKLNLATGAVVGETNVFVEYKANDIPASTEEYPVKGFTYLAMNYVLVGSNMTTTDLEFAIYETDKTVATSTITVSNVPVKPNYRTNIYGSLITKPADFKVDVQAGFTGTEGSMNLTEVSTVLELTNAIANGGEITLLADIEVNESIEVSKNTVINLNGKNISYTGTGELFTVVNGAILTVNKTEKLTKANDETKETIINDKGYIFTVEEGGKLYLDADVEYIANVSVVYVDGGEAYISAGEFRTLADDTNSAKYLLDHNDSKKNDGLIKVTGGTFHGFNPKESYSEDPAMNFLAEGYYTEATVVDEDGRTVYAVIEGEKIIDLASSGCANCYIVSGEGKYTFPATYKGNETTASIDKESIASVELLWESFGTTTAPAVNDLISEVSYSAEDGYVTFNASDLEGNALIAVKNQEGTILWSWHIWLTDVPQDQEYRNNAGIMMDRNLGATSATPEDGMLTYGLFYQWGRKDPFISRSYNSGADNSGNMQSVGKEWPTAVNSSSETGTGAYADANPMTFIVGTNYNPYSWLNEGASSSAYLYRWDAEGTNTKTINDPCPNGYRVPYGGNRDVNGIWSTAFEFDLYRETFYNPDAEYSSSQYIGLDFASNKLTKKLMDSGICWYPGAGYLDAGSGKLGFDFSGNYWASNLNAYSFPHDVFFEKDGRVYSVHNVTSANGMSVRCQKVTN